MSKDQSAGLCQDCGEREPLPELPRCLECTNDALPERFELPEDTREIAERRLSDVE